MHRTKIRLLGLWFAALTVALGAEGCDISIPPSTSIEQVSSTYTNGEGKNCRATIKVEETINGNTVSLHRDGVPCSEAAAVKTQMVAEAKAKVKAMGR